MYRNSNVIAANVINNSNQNNTITDSNGEFEILAGVGDEIIFSSVEFKILNGQGTATVEEDFLNVDGILGFSPNERAKTIEVQTLVDFKRDKRNINAKVAAIHYDPHRNARLALLFYEDGEKRYIIAPAGVKVGQNVISGESVPIEDGNAMPLSVMPLGSSVHCVELYAGRGAQMVRKDILLLQLE